MKKSIIIISILLSTFVWAQVDKIVIAGPFATVSHPILHMIETGSLNDIAKKVEFKLWRNPDELRALVLHGDVDFTAIPTNVGANLYNKGVDLQLLNVSIWGILGMVSRDKDIKTLAAYKGKEIAVPFREDMPDIVFKELLKRQGLDPKKDFKLRYVSSPIDAMQMLIMRRVDHALLAEPAISIALRKTKSFPLSVIAPDLYRSVDLQTEWAKVFTTDDKVPQAGIAVLGKKDPIIIERFLEEYKKSIEWYKQNPKEASELTVKTLKMLESEGLADSIPYVRLESIEAKDAQDKLEFFFNILREGNPKLIGGKLPDKGFYYGK
jgi:NitT/TauT family transport system substrate-binding protein